MLKKSASCVLASFRPSTYPRGYVEALLSLRPCWTAFLNTLQAIRETKLHHTRNRLLLVALSGLLALSGPAVSSLYAQDYPPDIARGKAVYTRHCLACHGAGGRGDGPAAAGLRVGPANFHRVQSFLKSDEELLRTIEHGVVFSPMHAWRGQLTDGEMNDVLTYIRLLSQQGQ